MSLTDEDKQWVREQLERVETSLLTPFHKWVSAQEMRERAHAAAIKVLDPEMEYRSDRVTKLEGSK